MPRKSDDGTVESPGGELCSWCNHPLRMIDHFNTEFHVLVCVNYDCRLYRSPQGNIPIKPEENKFKGLAYDSKDDVG